MSLPAGEIAIEVVTVEGMQVCRNKLAEPPLFRLSRAGDNSIALGEGSEQVSGALSVGSTAIARQLKHVAVSLANTDLLITQTLTDYSAYADQRQAVVALAQQLAALDAQLDEIETAIEVAENQPPSAPVLMAPDNGATALDPNAVTVTWRPASDADGDPLEYSVSWCDDASFSGCAPVVVAGRAVESLMYTALGGGGVLALGLVAPGLRRRSPQLRVVSAASLIALISACGGGSSSDENRNMEYTISGLNSATTYYWKVSVSDGTATVDSTVRSFSTR